VRGVDSHDRPDNGLRYLVYDNSRKTTLPYIYNDQYLAIVKMKIFEELFFETNAKFNFFAEFPCGKNFILNSQYVVNGSPIGHWPWMASYGFVNKRHKWEHRCGATLISDKYFLTAAHCIKYAEEAEDEG
jgi:hypothetical protein